MARTNPRAETPAGYARLEQTLNHDRADATPGNLTQALLTFISDALTLLVLEGRLAIISLIVMLAVGVFAAVLLVSVWLFLLATIAVGLVAVGWPWAVVLLFMAGINLVLVLICALVIRRLSGNVLFSATRRSLRTENS